MCSKTSLGIPWSKKWQSGSTFNFLGQRVEPQIQGGRGQSWDSWASSSEAAEGGGQAGGPALGGQSQEHEADGGYGVGLERHTESVIMKTSHFVYLEWANA